jgi:hypothetical protein
MTSGGSFEVVPEDLLAHASHLAGLVDRLNTASAASVSAMSDSAYGLLCSFLPPIINPTGEQAADTVKAAGEALSTSADNVRKAATSYQDNEDSSAQPFLNSSSQMDDTATVTPYKRSDSPTSNFRVGTTVQEK